MILEGSEHILEVRALILESFRGFLATMKHILESIAVPNIKFRIINYTLANKPTILIEFIKRGGEI